MQKTIEHEIIIRYPWGNANLKLGSHILPCWAVYDALARLEKHDSFTDESFEDQFNDSEYATTMRFVAYHLTQHDILFWDAGARCYERGEHYNAYWRFFGMEVESQEDIYLVSNRGSEGRTEQQDWRVYLDSSHVYD